MDKKDVIRKISALLARGDEERNDNEHEREIALRHAQKLMDEYNISQLEANVAMVHGERGKTGILTGKQVWKRQVYHALSELYGVTVYHSGDYCYLIGGEVNREVLLSMGQYVAASIEREARKYPGRGRKWHNSFKKGSVLGIMNTVRSIVSERSGNDQPTSSGKGLVLYNDKEVELNMEYINVVLNIRLSHRTARLNSSSRDGLESGRRFGSSVSLNDQVGGGSSTKLLS